jgi:hypothetical protein
MSQWKIKNILLPKRCEVCHKTDLFDPLKSTCMRCSTTSSVENVDKLSFKNIIHLIYIGNFSLKIIMAFFFGGLIAGFTFGQLTKIRSFDSLYYTKVQYWRIPTFEFWVCAGIIFLFGLIASYTLVCTQKWLPTVISKLTLRQLVAILIIPSAFPIMHLVTFSDIYLLLSPVIGSLLVSLALWLFTNRWYKTLVFLMIVAGVSATLLANIIIMLCKSYLTFDDFEILRFSIGYCSLGSLCGYWLDKASND